jgi:hypothetical protein
MRSRSAPGSGRVTFRWTSAGLFTTSAQPPTVPKCGHASGWAGDTSRCVPGKSFAGRTLRPIAARRLPAPRDLMVLCAQEMNHLGGFLPALYDRSGNA